MLTGSYGLWHDWDGGYPVAYTLGDQRRVVRIAAASHRRDVYAR